MAKSDSRKRAELMAKEWKKSRSTTKFLGDLVDMGLLHGPELGGWRAPEGESYPVTSLMLRLLKMDHVIISIAKHNC